MIEQRDDPASDEPMTAEVVVARVVGQQVYHARYDEDRDRPRARCGEWTDPDQLATMSRRDALARSSIRRGCVRCYQTGVVCHPEGETEGRDQEQGRTCPLCDASVRQLPYHLRYSCDGTA